MKVIHTISELQKEISSLKSEGKTIGLVPTMGALHQGHISLVRRCVDENDVCVVSIFVNPTQFNDKNDFLHYPHTFKDDRELLNENGCSIIFAPSEQEMYPQPDTRVFDFGLLDKVMEGKFRPGHFNGVAQIVSKLFDAVTPDKAYFGTKDFQQSVVIKAMVKQLNYPVKIIECPIVREPDGLAMSSRNMRLTFNQRQIAVKISQALNKSRNFAAEKPISEIIDRVTNEINSEPMLKVEYFDIVDGNTLMPVTDWNDSDYIVGCIAVFCGEVRLIDNIVYKESVI
ncbi:MAG: pantoate--beta-alanine ligase [Candidatus Azobacteroides sp.]|nr:pantoate--beta-alanine ligase [Candidatus Azobacteroides sp.]